MMLAMDKNNLIGSNGDLPWHLPADLKRFKDVTTGQIIVMGRKTLESIGRALPNRTNVVITRDTSYEKEGVIVLHSIEALKEYAAKQEKEVIVIGGAELIEQVYNAIDTFYITHINHAFEGDCHASFINVKHLNLVSQEKMYPDEKNKYFYSFCTYER